MLHRVVLCPPTSIVAMQPAEGWRKDRIFIETAGRCFGASLNDIRAAGRHRQYAPGGPSAALETAANGVDGDTGAASIHVSHSSKLHEIHQ